VSHGVPIQADQPLTHRTEIYCFDLESAFQILFQVWALRDAGNERASWRDVQPAPGEAWILM
jgi:hypothetical protein